MLSVFKTRVKIVEDFQSGKIDFWFSLVVFGIVCGLLLSSSTMGSTEKNVALANNQFATNLYKILSKKEGNVFFSPISLHAVLSMAYQGAQGSTAEKFASALLVDEPKSVADGYSKIIANLNSVEKVTLHLANKVFIMQGFDLLPEFATSLTKNFLSEVQALDFAQNAAAAKTINDWVEDKTNKKIKDLIEAGDLDRLTRLVLVNAIYFKGNWKHKFDVANTKTEPFYLNDNDHVDVQMMHIKKNFNYKADAALDAQVLELPYTNENLSMIIILPNQRNGIGELEKKLENVNLDGITAGMRSIEVNVALPKFKIEKTIALEDTLTELGLEEIFDQDKANFRGMIELKPNENLYVTKVIQKAFIEVNEEGAEAAAATGMVMMMRCALITQSTFFTADHPFVFVLSQDRTNGLFAGRLSHPNAS